MQSAVAKAIELILSGDAELLNILSVTAKMSLQSSLLALCWGCPSACCWAQDGFRGGMCCWWRTGH